MFGPILANLIQLNAPQAQVAGVVNGESFEMGPHPDGSSVGSLSGGVW
jgi:hypothetical protein